MLRTLTTLLLVLIQIGSFAQTLNTPSLVTPSNNAVSQQPDVLLDWGSVTGATSYEVHYGTDPALNTFSVWNVSSSQVNAANLFFGTTYFWKVKARSASDSSNWSVIWNFTVLDTVLLVSPANFAVNQPPNVLLDWATLSGINGYQVQLDTTATFNSSLLQSFSTGTTSQSNTANLRFGTTWHWRIRAFHSNDTTIWSEVRSFSTIDIVSLVAPVNNAINQSSNELLDWTAISGVSGYIVQTDTSAGFNSALLNTVTMGTTSQMNTANLLFGTTYYWRVKAIHSADSSQWSNLWSFTTIDTVYLVSPLNGAVMQDPSTLLDWTGLSGINGYQVQYDTTPAFNSALLATINQGTTSQLNTSSLLFGKMYYWRVKGFHATDTSGWSATWSFITRDTLYLIAPSNGATFQDPSLVVDWAGINGISGYMIQYDTSSSFSSPLLSNVSAGTTSQLTVSSLLFGTTYFWRVKAFHATDTSGWSVTWSFTIRDTLYLIAPLNGATTQAPSTLLDWAGIGGITGYQIQLDTNNSFSSPGLINSFPGTASQFNTFNLLFGTDYHWRVRAFHPLDTSGWSDVWTFRTTDTLFLLTPVNNATAQPLNLPLDWAGISGVIGYEVQLSPDSLFNNPSAFINASSIQAVSNLSYGTWYFWRVRSFHNNDTSSWTASWKFQTIFQINSIPLLVYPGNGAANVPVSDTVKWMQVNDPLVSSFEIQLDDNNTFASPQSFVTSDTISPFNGLSGNTTYYWRVRCKNGSGNGPWSVTWSFTTLLNVGIEQPAVTTVRAYPNPIAAGGAFQLLLDDTYVFSMEIHAIDGRLIERQAYPSGTLQVGGIFPSPGIYIVHLLDQMGESLYNSKFLVQ